MRWIEAVIETKSEEIEDLCVQLEALGVPGMVIEDEVDFKEFLENNQQYWDYIDEELEQRFRGRSQVKFYLPDDMGGAEIIRRIRSKLGLSPQISYVADSDWENNWKEFYRPMEIGHRLMVVPQWESPDTGDRIPLRLDPGLTFGTGSHATTRMCLCQVENHSGPGKRVLDLGCGSGILSIAALLCGCREAVGCDIDPKTPDVAMSNAALNGIGPDRFQVYAGDILADEVLRARLGGVYDLVLANIVADVIIPLTAMVRRFLVPGGLFICSGIIEGRQDEVESALVAHGFEIVSRDCQEDWYCYCAK
ncbi:MAG TPA: 50S ribosomal protein L11 methyltransferase [Clostridiales bacterium]|nr:50S ribosomal protein L11 methyltransferase [Clostridiales bacterium]